MKYAHYLLAAGSLLMASVASAQEAIPSGEIRYEVTRRIDLSQMRININGREVRPGGTLPNGQTLDIPPTTTFGQTLLFANGLAMEKREQSANMMRFERGPRPDGGDRQGGDGGRSGGGGGADSRGERRDWRSRFNAPIENTVYIDMASQNLITLMSIKKDSLTTEYYRNDTPIERDSTWKEDDKTRKIAGYKCQKATANLRNTPYTIWYTTELPFTYSPVPSLTPDKGVVLQIESDQEAYKATKIEAKPIDEATLKPNPKAQLVSKKTMEDLRRKAMASFRQRMMAENPQRN